MTQHSSLVLSKIEILKCDLDIFQKGFEHFKDNIKLAIWIHSVLTLLQQIGQKVALYFESLHDITGTFTVYIKHKESFQALGPEECW